MDAEGKKCQLAANATAGKPYDCRASTAPPQAISGSSSPFRLQARLLSLSTIFNVAAALPAGQATLDLFAPGRSHDVVWATGAGAVWFLGVLTLVTFGITASAKAQVVLTLLESGAIILVCGLAIFKRARRAGRRLLLGLVFSFGFWHIPIIFGRNAGGAFLLFQLGRIREPRGRNG